MNSQNQNFTITNSNSTDTLDVFVTVHKITSPLEGCDLMENIEHWFTCCQLFLQKLEQDDKGAWWEHSADSPALKRHVPVLPIDHFELSHSPKFYFHVFLKHSCPSL